MTSRRRAPNRPLHSHPGLASDPLWYKDAILYEVRLSSYADSDADGIGDFRGLIEKLDYVQDLGVSALWLLPFYPSPRRDDGYDIADYTAVHPDAGTLDDFQELLHQSHRRGVRVITELVINHTSDKHPWFERARRAAPESRFRDFYVWSDSAARYQGTRVIFQDFESSNWAWDPVAGAYYWHRFYAHQPDLNFASADVRKAVLGVLDFWLGMGVDGLRLDAVPYLFEREGTSCENLPETHGFLRELRAHVDARYADRMLLAEANQWPEDAATYFGAGDECHMAFHFPVMPRLFMALHMEDRFPIVEILSQTPQIPESCQWALFLRNHDELTLEMVTDEERDYMYRVYAHDRQARLNLGIRRRLAPLLQNDRRRIELLNALLCSLPGTPVIYYGDEIGMGDNIYLGDRNGVRTPMQWSSDRNAGFSRATPQRLFLPVIIDPERHYESVNVESQSRNPSSLLNWMKRLLALRKRHPAFGRGSIEFLSPSNRKVLAFVRVHGGDHLLVLANLSRFVEYVELDLSAFRGRVPVELFSARPFPAIDDRPYFVTLGPHAFYWFTIEEPRALASAGVRGSAQPHHRLVVDGAWTGVFDETARSSLEDALRVALPACRWFDGKSARIRLVRIDEAIALGGRKQGARLAFVRVELDRGAPATYVVPMAFVSGAAGDRICREQPQCVLAELSARPEGAHGEVVDGWLVDGAAVPEVAQALLDWIVQHERRRTAAGELVGTPMRALRSLRGEPGASSGVRLLGGEHSNSVVVFGDRLLLKLVRRLPGGMSPDQEVGRFLAEHGGFVHVPPVAGAIEYRVSGQDPATVAVLSAFIPNEGDLWRHTLDRVEHYFEVALARRAELGDPPDPGVDVLVLVDRDPPALVGELFGESIEMARLLGRRTAELHLALASDPDDPAFAPEPFTALYQRGRFQSIRNLVARVLGALREAAPALREDAASSARELLAREAELVTACRALLGSPLPCKRIRCHGDFHLGQVLRTGSDFVVIDFEGEPTRPLGERRFKTSPLRDVAGMLRSFDYATQHPLLRGSGRERIRPEDVPALAPWARFWRQWVSSSFLRRYLRGVAGSGLVPEAREPLALLLRVLVLEKNVYEVGYELEHRPEWVGIPIRGILEILGSTEPSSANRP